MFFGKRIELTGQRDHAFVDGDADDCGIVGRIPCEFIADVGVTCMSVFILRSLQRCSKKSTLRGAAVRRLGTVQSKGCIRIPATLNRFLDHLGVLDAAYEEAARDGSKLWVLDARRQPWPAWGGTFWSWVQAQRPALDWSPAPFTDRLQPEPPASRP